MASRNISTSGKINEVDKQEMVDNDKKILPSNLPDLAREVLELGEYKPNDKKVRKPDDNVSKKHSSIEAKKNKQVESNADTDNKTQKIEKYLSILNTYKECLEKLNQGKEEGENTDNPKQKDGILTPKEIDTLVKYLSKKMNDNIIKSQAGKNDVPEKELADDANSKISGEESTGVSEKYLNKKIETMSSDEIECMVEDIRVNAGSPIEIPKEANVKAQSKKAGYEQIQYKWNDGTYTYTARWHTSTPNAPEGTKPNWRVDRKKTGSPGGRDPVTGKKIQGTLAVDEAMIIQDDGKVSYVPLSKWKAASVAYRKREATSEQKKLLKQGHFEAH